jgi:hypothetical protein
VSDADSFIREVTEEVRRDRLNTLWRRFGPFIVGGLVGVVLVSAGLQWWGHRQDAAAQEAGARLLRALEADDPSVRAAELDLAAETLDTGPARLARLVAAASEAQAGEAAAAAAVFDGLAADAGASDTMAAFAAYRAAMLRAETAGALDTEAALTPLAEGDGPFRLLALEGRAAARAFAGDHAGARSDIEAILAAPSATEGLRQRAAALADTLPPADG